MTTRWIIGIDWDRDGCYTDETARVLSAKWMLGFQQAYMDVGNDAQLRLVLRNDDKRFSPENSAGPLSGKLAPLRPLRVTSDDGSTVRTHWSGWINMILPRRLQLMAIAQSKLFKNSICALNYCNCLARTNPLVI